MIKRHIKRNRKNREMMETLLPDDRAPLQQLEKEVNDATSFVEVRTFSFVLYHLFFTL